MATTQQAAAITALQALDTAQYQALMAYVPAMYLSLVNRGVNMTNAERSFVEQIRTLLGGDID